METKKYIGIYISQHSAAVACLSPAAKDYKISDFFTVSVDRPQPDSTPADDFTKLAELISQAFSQKAIAFQDGNIVLAVDCSMFMQHNIHSDFADPKQISQTIRFDTEEALATDISDLAVSFSLSHRQQAGSDVTVFTAQKKLLLDCLDAFQKNKIDPVVIEPDCICLTRFLLRYPSLKDNSPAVLAVLSRANGYLIASFSSQPNEMPVIRTFVIGPAQNRESFLKVQIPLTTALLPDDTQPQSVKIFDCTNSVDNSRIESALAVKTEPLDPTASVQLESSQSVSLENQADFAIAAGAALALADKTAAVDFRADFSPYQGRQKRLQKTIQTISIAAAICFLALGIFLQNALFAANKPRSRLKASFEKDYIIVIPDTKKLPTHFTEAVERLKRELNRLQNYGQGRLESGQQSVSSRLTLLLAAFNSCAQQTQLEIDSINITNKNIQITGSTSSEQNTIQFRQVLQQNKLIIKQEDLNPKGGRHFFNIELYER